MIIGADLSLLGEEITPASPGGHLLLASEGGRAAATAAGWEQQVASSRRLGKSYRDVTSGQAAGVWLRL